MTRAWIIELKGQRSRQSQKSWDQQHERKCGQQTPAWSPTDHDFILSSEVGRLAQQLALRHGDGAGGLSYQHGVVEPHPSWRWGNQVSTLSAQKDGRQGARLGGELINGPMKIGNFPNPRHLNTPRIRSLGLHTAAAKCDFALWSIKAKHHNRNRQSFQDFRFLWLLCRLFEKTCFPKSI